MSIVQTSGKRDYKSNIELVDLLVSRRMLINDLNDSDLNEYNKKINFSYDNIAVNNDEATVYVTVTKTWKYVFSPNIESGAIDEYQFKLKKIDNVWKVKEVIGLVDEMADLELAAKGNKITAFEKDNLLENVQDVYIDFQKKVKTEQIISTLPASRATYNTINATNYALKWALSYNPAYANFTKLGGDCTNFTSQCLYAGGITQHVGTPLTDTCWYYKSSSDRSSSWTGANQFRRYTTSSSSKINRTSSNWSSVSSGDIIQLHNSSGTAYHSLIITGIEQGSYGRKDLLVCAHTSNRRHVSLATYYSSPTKSYSHIIGTK